MDSKMLQQFLMWCSILDIGFLLLWTAAFCLIPDFIYRQKCLWGELSREAFNAANYRLLGTFKIIVIVFNVVPYLALLILSKPG